EEITELLPRQKVRVDQLERASDAGPEVAGAVHHGHPARAQKALDEVAAIDQVAGGDRGTRKRHGSPPLGYVMSARGARLPGVQSSAAARRAAATFSGSW